MQVNVLVEVLPPGVQHRGHAELTIKTFRIGSEGLEGFPDALEQQRIDNLRV